jgi:quercetin dioxygenase-like cupin family protein
VRTVLISHGARRVVATPNATMSTLASPSLSGSAQLSMWTVEMAAGQRGPLHTFNSEQIWTLTKGSVSIEVDGERIDLADGDTITLAGSAERQITAIESSRLIVCGYGQAIVSVNGETSARGTPAWIA